MSRLVYTGNGSARALWAQAGRGRTRGVVAYSQPLDGQRDDSQPLDGQRDDSQPLDGQRADGPGC